MNKLKALLGFDPKTTTVKTELIAGMTTFLTMCYILAVNPTILATTASQHRSYFLPVRFHGLLYSKDVHGGFLPVAGQHLRYHRNSSGIGFQTWYQGE